MNRSTCRVGSTSNETCLNFSEDKISWIDNVETGVERPTPSQEVVRDLVRYFFKFGAKSIYHPAQYHNTRPTANPSKSCELRRRSCSDCAHTHRSSETKWHPYTNSPRGAQRKQKGRFWYFFSIRGHDTEEVTRYLLSESTAGQLIFPS